MSSNPRHLYPTVCVALVLLATALPVYSGQFYEIRSNIESEYPMGETVIHTWVDGKESCTQIVNSPSPLVATGRFMITTDGGETVYMINDQMQTYSLFDIKAVGGMMGGMGGMTIEYSEPQVELLEERDGGRIAGLPTRYYRYRMEYDEVARVFGMGRKSHVVEEREFWINDTLDPIMEFWMSQGNQVGPNEDFNRLIEAEMSMIKGFPMKSVRTSTHEKRKGRSSSMRMIHEVTATRQEAMPASRCRIPDGYREVQSQPAFGGDGKNPLSDFMSRVGGG